MKPASHRKGVPPRRRRKTLDLNQQLLNDARRALGCETETETVHRALEGVVARARAAEGLRRLGGRKLFDVRKIED